MDDRPFRILCICTGNICRSPAAERLLAHRLGPSVQVGSAGTFGLQGSPIAEPMAARLRAAGVDADGFAARRLTVRELDHADLVLGLTKGHRRDAVELAPATVRRAFTLRELARLLAELDPSRLPAGTPGQRLQAAVPLAAALRRPARGDDIDDPFGLADPAYERAYAEISAAVEQIAAVVNPDRESE